MHAENWALLQLGDNAAPTWSIDIDSIAVTAQYRKAWVRVDYSSPQDLDPSFRTSPTNLFYQNALVLYYVECSSQMISTPQANYYSPKDEFVGSFSGKFNPELLRDVAPGTIAKRVLDYICRRGR